MEKSIETILSEVAELRQGHQFRAAMQRLLALDVHRPDVAYHGAWVLDAEGRDEEAIRWYQRALKSSAAAGPGATLSAEDHLGAFLGLAMVLLRSGRAEHAVDVLSAASSRFPGSEKVSALQTLARARGASAAPPVAGGQ